LVSSSGVRRAIEAGNVSLAGRFLARPYSLEGEVVAGHGVGSKQTVPTLNLRTSAQVLPLAGVYITRTTDLGTADRRWNSITNVGTRPTFDGHELTIETFLLDRFEPPAPARIAVEFLERVREERKFETPAALKAQILRDVARATRFFARLQKWVPSALK
jgi:riboflavin kinase/FMN adenylyltransferase